MARPTPEQWIAKNPPRDGETADQYRRRYEMETSPTLMESGLSAAGDFGRGAITGGFRGIGSTVRAIGELTGSRTMRSGGADMEALADEYRKATMSDPEGFAGKAGEVAGRAGLEIGAAYAGSRAGTSVLRRGAPLVGRFLPSAAKGMRYLSEGLEKGGALRRALSSAVVNAPVDIIQGAGSDSGMILPGRAGSIAENMLFSGAGGAIDAGLDARRAAKARRAYESPEMVGPFRASGLPDYNYGPFPSPFSPAIYERRLLTSGIPAPTQGPAVPTGAPRTPLLLTAGAPESRVFNLPGQIATPRERGVAVMRTNQAATPATGFAEAGEAASQDVLALREQLQNMSEADLQRWMAMNMPGASEEEILQMMTEMLPVRSGRKGTRTGVPLSRGEEQSLRGVRPAMMRPRRGAASAELLSSLTGAGAGGLYGFATGETEEERLARALAYGTAGGGLGFGATRFFKGGGTGVGSAAQSIESGATSAARQRTVSPPKTATPMANFPENRTPLVKRSGVSELDPAEEFILQTRVREIEPTITRPYTEAQLRKEAEQYISDKSLGAMLNLSPERVTAAESLALLSVHRDLRKRVLDQTERLKTATDPDEIGAIGDNIESLDNLSAKFLAKIMKADTAAGRALAARRFMAKEITDPTYWYIKASRVKGGDILSDAEKLQIDKLSREADPEKLLQYLASIQKSSKLEQVASLRASGLLTALPGRLRDVLSTSANYISTVAQRYPGSFADAMAAKAVAKRAGGTADQYRTMLAPTRDEFGSALRGAREGLLAAAESMGYNAARKGGLDGWVNAIRQAEIDPDMAKRLEVPSLVNIDLFSGRLGEKANVFLDTYSKAVMRSAGVTDKIINTAALRGALNEQARLISKRTGQSVDELLAKPTDEMLLNAKQVADYVTFTNDGTIANGIAGAIERFASAAEAGKKGNGALVRAGARFIMPFRRTPANILSRALEYSPGVGTIMAGKAARDWTKELALSSLKGVSPELAKSQRRMVELLTKQASGAAMFALGAMLYNNGRLTGEMPESTGEREQWALEGKKPESILINGEWLPIARISPFGGMMTLAASVMKNAEGIDQTAGVAQQAFEGVSKGAQSTLASVLNQPMVTGPQEALAALTGRSERGGDNPLADFAGSMAGSFVPTAVAQAARTEGIQRRPETLLQEVTSRIPGMQDTAPARLDIFGEPVRSGGGVLNTMVNPLTSTADRRAIDPLVAELSRVGANIAPMSRGKGESTEMYNYRQREAGRVIRQTLTELIQSNDYNAATPTQRKRLIRDVVQSVRRELSDYLREQYNIRTSGDES